MWSPHNQQPCSSSGNHQHSPCSLLQVKKKFNLHFSVYARRYKRGASVWRRRPGWREVGVGGALTVLTSSGVCRTVRKCVDVDEYNMKLTEELKSMIPGRTTGAPPHPGARRGFVLLYAKLTPIYLSRAEYMVNTSPF